jgi:hypothetical protein
VDCFWVQAAHFRGHEASFGIDLLTACFRKHFCGLSTETCLIGLCQWLTRHNHFGAHTRNYCIGSYRLRLTLRPCWKFPEGYSDVVELSEADFLKNAHLDEPKLMKNREERTPVGDLLVSFLKLDFRAAAPLYLMMELSVKLPAENQSFMRFLLSKTGFHMRLRGGGVGVVNLAQLSCYTVAGVAQVPSDTRPAEPLSISTG